MKFILSKVLYSNAAALLASFALCVCAQAGTVSVTFQNAPTGVDDGHYYVLPYALTVNGTLIDATCYDVFDDVVGGQSWTANLLTLNEAASVGQFSSDTNALASYEDVGFLSQQTTGSSQNQIDLQHDIWNVFDPGLYSVTTGMQAYLNLLNTAAFTSFDFSQIAFLEDSNQGTGRAQAFVITSVSETPEPGTILLTATGALLIALASTKRRTLPTPAMVLGGPQFVNQR